MKIDTGELTPERPNRFFVMVMMCANPEDPEGRGNRLVRIEGPTDMDALASGRLTIDNHHAIHDATRTPRCKATLGGAQPLTAGT